MDPGRGHRGGHHDRQRRSLRHVLLKAKPDGQHRNIDEAAAEAENRHEPAGQQPDSGKQECEVPRVREPGEYLVGGGHTDDEPDRRQHREGDEDASEPHRRDATHCSRSDRRSQDRAGGQHRGGPPIERPRRQKAGHAGRCCDDHRGTRRSMGAVLSDVEQQDEARDIDQPTADTEQA